MKWLFASGAAALFVLVLVDCVGDTPSPGTPDTNDGGGLDASGADTFVPTEDSGADGGADAHVAETRWTLTYGTTSLESPFFQTAADGTSAIAGVYKGQPNIGGNLLPAPANNGLFVARLDVNGGVVWLKTFDFAGTTIDPSNIAAGDDGRVYLAGDGAGFSFGNGADVPAASGSDRHGFIVRFAAADGAVEGITIIKASAGAIVKAPRLERTGDVMIAAAAFRGTVAFDGAGTQTVSAAGCATGVTCGLFAVRYDGVPPGVSWFSFGTVTNGSASIHDVAYDGTDVLVGASFTADSASWATKSATAIGNVNAEDALLVKLSGSNGGAVWASAYGDPTTTAAAKDVTPNAVAIANDKTVVVAGDFANQVQVGTTLVSAVTPIIQGGDGYVAGFQGDTGAGIWAKGVGGNDFETMPALVALPSGDVLSALRYQSGGIVVDGAGLQNPAVSGAGLALLRWNTTGKLVSAVSAGGITRALGPRLATLPNDGVGIAFALTGTVTLGPLMVTSDTNGTTPSSVFAGVTF